ncbi:MAG: ATP-dependent zinc protease [Thermoplasmatota archaeon]
MDLDAASTPVIGWREWIGLPRLGIDAVKVKVDTGARTSALHAFDVERFEHKGVPWVRFTVRPFQKDADHQVTAEAKLAGERLVRDSGGHETLRPAIRTTLDFAGHQWRTEVTLADRDAMGFRMLLGRRAVRGRFLVDAKRSFYGGVPGGLPAPAPGLEDIETAD